MNHTELNVLSKEETTIKQMEAERKLGKRQEKKSHRWPDNEVLD
jgi:hypothetical protein